MTIMIESSRTFLFTEYARTGCGTLHTQGTDPKAWDKLPVSQWKGSSQKISNTCAGQVLHLPWNQGASSTSQGR
jgi:hypothetical protein